MAASSLLALIDDIATLLDDVSVLTKVAAKKTAGVLGDDLAVNAEQVTGVRADRELPVVWAVFKGSVLNKLILVPAALAISVFIPWLITPLLMLGGLFLCYEGFEKVAHRFLHSRDEDEREHEARLEAVADEQVDMVAFEKDKVRGAIRTDFVLSAEIIVITLGTVSGQPFAMQVAVVSVIAAVMTIGVYGLVAGIVKLDDLGLHLAGREGGFSQALGRGVLWLAPRLMKFLSVAGTVAMFLVGGGILVHGIPGAEAWLHEMMVHVSGAAGQAGAAIAAIGPMLANGVLGVLAGAVVVSVVGAVSRLRGASA
jgi:predicted DNA repair protein MutK